MVNAVGYVGALLVDGGDDRDVVAVKAVFRAVIAYLAHGLAHDGGDVRIAVGGYFAKDGHHAGGGGAFAGHAGHFVVGEDGVQNRVGYLVAELVGMTLGDGFGSENSVHAHGFARPRFKW